MCSLSRTLPDISSWKRIYEPSNHRFNLVSVGSQLFSLNFWNLNGVPVMAVAVFKLKLKFNLYFVGYCESFSLSTFVFCIFDSDEWLIEGLLWARKLRWFLLFLSLLHLMRFSFSFLSLRLNLHYRIFSFILSFLIFYLWGFYEDEFIFVFSHVVFSVNVGFNCFVWTMAVLMPFLFDRGFESRLCLSN